MILLNKFKPLKKYSIEWGIFLKKQIIEQYIYYNIDFLIFLNGYNKKYWKETHWHSRSKQFGDEWIVNNYHFLFFHIFEIF